MAKTGLAKFFDPYSGDGINTGFGSNLTGFPSALKNSDNDVPGSYSGDFKQIDTVTNLRGIFGIPYQFMESVDGRATGMTIGRKYSEKILAKSPLLFLTPCTQEFMEGFSGRDQATILDALVSSGSVDENSLQHSGKYYTTKFAYDEYYKTVNKMCSELTYFLGIGDVELPGLGKLKNVSWDNSVNEAFKKYYSASRAVVFYMDGNSVATVSDSFSNSRTESSLANTINGFRDQARELQFLLGPKSALTALMNQRDNVITETTANILEATNGVTGEMLTDLAATGINTVLSGGKMVFPKIWGDATYARSYGFDIKLRSPDHDKLSIFLNVLVPYIHLMGMVLPRTLESQNPNAYQSPLLVKAYCKGMFNIDMGLITDMSVSRGAECQWNDDGLPTQIDISLQVEDLYQSLMISNLDAVNWNPLKANMDGVTNTGMMDYLANMAGLNVANVELARKYRMLTFLSVSDIARFPSTVYTIADNKIQNLWHRITRNLM